GPDSFTYVAHDGEADSAPATYTLTILPVNDAPVAKDIRLEVEAGSPIAITLEGTDVASEVLQFALTSQPAHGQLSGTAPSLVYTSDRHFSGLETFTYSVSDGELTSAPATVEIQVVRNNEP